MKGKVKWFDPIRGYGFLLTDDGKEHFVHISDLKYSGYDTLTIDELIEFDIAQYGKRFKAINFKKVLQNHLDTEGDFHSFLYKCLTNKDLEISAEKGKGDIQIEQAIGFLLSETSAFKLIDYGCGKGRLLEGLKTLDDARKKNLTYIGVNKEYPHDAEKVAKNYEIKAEFYTTEDFEKLDLKAKYLYLINVLHEVPLNELPSRLYYILAATGFLMGSPNILCLRSSET